MKAEAKGGACSCRQKGLGDVLLSLLSHYLLQKSAWEGHEGLEGVGTSTVTQVLSRAPFLRV